MNFTIATYNVQRDRDNMLPWYVLNIPEFANADVIVLQEMPSINAIESGAYKGRGITLSYIQRMRSFMVDVAVESGGLLNREFSNAFLCHKQIAILGRRNLVLSCLGKLSLFERFKIDGGEPEPKHSLLGIFKMPDDTVLRIANVHLDFAGGIEHRKAQLRQVVDAIDELDDHGPKTVDIICGDFNTIGAYEWPRTHRNTASVIRIAEERGYLDCTKEIAWTHDMFTSISPYDFFRHFLSLGKLFRLRWHQKLDHILVRGVKSVVRTGVVLLEGDRFLHGSDHAPVYVEIEI